MSDQYLTLTQLEDLFQTLTVSMLGGSPPADIRISWQSDGAPAFTFTDNVGFIRITEEPNYYNIAREVKYFDVSSPDGLLREISYTRVIKVRWVFYGPLAYENASLIREAIYYQENHNILAEQKIYHVVDDAHPIRMPENFQGRWWNRYDIEMFFYEQIIRSTEVGYVKSVDVTIIQESNNQTEINII